jgi:hypothetical protein
MRQSRGFSGGFKQLPRVVRPQVGGVNFSEIKSLTAVAQASGNGIADAEIEAPIQTIALVEKDAPNPFAGKYAGNGCEGSISRKPPK